MDILILIVVISLCVVCTINLAFTLKVTKNNTSNGVMSNEDLNKVREAVLSSINPMIQTITSSIQMQNKMYMEQVERKIDEVKRIADNIVAKNNEFQVNMMKIDNEEFNKISNKMQSIIDTIQENQSKNITRLNDAFKDINTLINENNIRSTDQISKKFDEFAKIIKEKMESIDKNVGTNLENIRKDNNEKLDKIQGVVDEKLQKTLEERLNNSFKSVIEQIGGVNKAIGEIKGLATDVSSLKNVLANVKTKGIIGEVILGNLIREILTVGQYEENVKTKAGSNDPVEFAIKMPGEKDDEFVYLPVDSKFPTESYSRILDSIEQGNKEGIEAARKELKNNIKKFAKDISTKYIDEPNTTGFAIMFLPIEGLYAEVINMGMFEELQRDYKVCVCGPSTFAALLNALQMGFKSLVIQKKSAEVFKLLGGVKTEFGKFAETLEKVQTKMETAGKELDNLVGTRTRAMQRKLREIEEIPGVESSDLLGIENED